MGLPVSDVWCISRAHLATLAKSEVNALLRFPDFIQDLPTPFSCTGEKVCFKVLNTLFPPYSVTAFSAISEHFAIGENLVDWPESIRPGLLLHFPPCFAALIPGLPAFLACHNKSIRLSYR